MMKRISFLLAAFLPLSARAQQSWFIRKGEELLDRIDGLLFDRFPEIFNALSAYVEPAMWLALTLMIIWFAFSGMMAWSGFSFQEATRALGLFFVVIVVVTSYPLFELLVLTPLRTIPQEAAIKISGAISGLPVDDTNRQQVILSFPDAILRMSAALFSHASITNLAPAFLGLLCIVAGIIVGGVALVVYLMALVRMVLFISITPFMLIFLLFKQTKGLFEGWLRQAMGAAMLLIIVSVILGLILGVLTAMDLLNQLNQNSASANYLLLVESIPVIGLFSVIAVYLLKQADSIASGITGAVALHAPDIVKNIGEKAKSAFNKATRRSRYGSGNEGARGSSRITRNKQGDLRGTNAVRNLRARMRSNQPSKGSGNKQ